MVTKIVTTLLGLTLVLVVACGSAPAAPEPTATSAPPADAAPSDAPSPAAADTPAPAPTATPQPTAPSAEVTVSSEKLNVMMGSWDNERFDVAFTGGSTGSSYGRLLHGYLISDNAEKEMVPGIASDWEISADGLTTTFTIREGVKWHDGSDLVVEDVLWSLQHLMGPQAQDQVVASDMLVMSRDMDRIELSGPNQVSVITTQPHLELLNIMSEVSGQWFHMMPARDELYNEEVELAYDRNPIGAGPMHLLRHVRAQVMEFERFDDYYYQPDNGFDVDKRVKFQFLDEFLVPEEATRVAALRSGEADIAPASLSTKQQVEAGGGRLVFADEGVFLEVRLIGCWKPEFPCHDKRVRQALDYAIDKELIQNELYGGPEVFGIEGWGPVTPSTIGYTEDLNWSYDPDKARQLLADAGYPNGEGFGKLIVNTAPSISAPFIVEATQIVAEFWKRELGIDAEARVGDRTALREMERARELDGQIWFRDNEARVDALDTALGRFGDLEHPARLSEDLEIFNLVREVAGIVDPEERAKASEGMYKRLRDESYMLGIGYINLTWGVGPRVAKWEPYPVSLYPSALYTLELK